MKRRREHLGLSQLRCALETGGSPRHLSFLETGRAKPSREMVLLLGDGLSLSLREQNALLLSAGFAPAFPEDDLEAPALTAIRAAARRVIDGQEPFPAVVLDRRRDVVMHNQAAVRLLAGVDAALLVPPINAYRVLLHPAGLAPRIVGFGAYSRHLLGRLATDAARSGDADLFALLDEVQAYPGVTPLRGTAPTPGVNALTLRLRVAAGAELSFVATLATFGTPFDATVADLVIESLFPADDRTDAYLRGR